MGGTLVRGPGKALKRGDLSQDRKEVKEQVLWTFGGRAFRLREQQVPSRGRGTAVWEEECGQSREERR